jgi:hypothetical protein
MVLLSLQECNFKKIKSKWTFKVDKTTFKIDWKICVQIEILVRKLMKLICNKLGNEDQHMF